MTGERWHKMKLPEQMGNIGAEFVRMASLKEKGDLKETRNSLIRLLRLIDLTIEDKKLRGRLSEILRLREVICDIYLGNKLFKVSVGNLKKYFINFSYLI